MKIFSNLKKGILIPAAIILIASAGAGSTAAYFRHVQTVKNALSVGESTIEITEDYAPPKEMQQGENIYKKRVAVKKYRDRPVLRPRLCRVLRFGRRRRFPVI